jgi:hypothetical protein
VIRLAVRPVSRSGGRVVVVGLMGPPSVGCPTR